MLRLRDFFGLRESETPNRNYADAVVDPEVLQKFLVERGCADEEIDVFIDYMKTL